MASISPILERSHHPRPRKVERAPFGRLVKLGFFALGMPKHSLCSVDVTHRCNLRCKHCYFMEQHYSSELSVDEWEAQLLAMKRAAFPRPYFAFQCSWVGGEPLLRSEVIERCRRFFPFNIVVTNGTIPLPAWRDVHFFVSVDGTAPYHEAIRGEGTYQRIKAHTDRDDLNVMVTFCINRTNAECIEDFMIEWDQTRVRHVAFEFHTPIAGLACNDRLALSAEERDGILDKLLALRRIYKHFILPPPRTYRMMRSERAHDVTDACLYRATAVALGPDGKPKEPCMLGPKADCDRCGCIIPFVTRAQVDRKEILKDVAEGIWHRLSAPLRGSER